MLKFHPKGTGIPPLMGPSKYAVVNIMMHCPGWIMENRFEWSETNNSKRLCSSYSNNLCTSTWNIFFLSCLTPLGLEWLIQWNLVFVPFDFQYIVVVYGTIKPNVISTTLFCSCRKRWPQALSLEACVSQFLKYSSLEVLVH